MAGSALALQALAAGEARTRQHGLQRPRISHLEWGHDGHFASLATKSVTVLMILKALSTYRCSRAARSNRSPDMKGKVFATNGIGGGQDIYARVMLRKHGLEYRRLHDHRVELSTMKAMLLEKKADVVVGVEAVH